MGLKYILIRDFKKRIGFNYWQNKMICSLFLLRFFLIFFFLWRWRCWIFFQELFRHTSHPSHVIIIRIFHSTSIQSLLSFFVCCFNCRLMSFFKFLVSSVPGFVSIVNDIWFIALWSFNTFIKCFQNFFFFVVVFIFLLFLFWIRLFFSFNFISII